MSQSFDQRAETPLGPQPLFDTQMPSAQLVLIGVVTASALLGSCNKQAAAVAASPGNASDREHAVTWNFDRLLSGAIATHTFDLVADSRFSAGIDAIKSSCGCATTSVNLALPQEANAHPYEFGTPITPGSRIEISVRLDTSGKSGAYAGDMQVLASSAVLGLLRVEGLIQPLFDIEPKLLDLGTVNSLTGKNSDSVHITSEVLQRFHLDVDHADSNENLDFRLQPATDPSLGQANDWIFSVAFRPGATPTSRFITNVLLSPSSYEFNDEFVGLAADPSPISIIVQARIAQDPYLEPDSVSFGLIARGEEQEKRVQVLSFSGLLSSTEVPSVLIPPALNNERIRLSVNPKWTQGNPSYVLDFALYCSAEAPPGAFRSEVEVSLPSLPKPVIVPVFGIVR